MASSSKYDFENVVGRLRRAAEVHEKRQRHVERRQPGPGYRTPARRPVAATPPRRDSIWSRLAGAFRNESKQMIAASLVLLGFVGWLGSCVQSLYAQHVEAQLASECHNNHLAHAAAVYCFDKRRIVHTLNEDGAPKRSGLDWRINESALKKAESQARAAERGIQYGE